MLSAGSRARRAAWEKRTQDHPQTALIKAGCEDVEVGYPPPPPQWPATQGQMERTLGLESGSVSTWPRKVPVCSTQALLPLWYRLASGHCVLSACFL